MVPLPGSFAISMLVNRPIRVLVPFNTPYLYGLERVVLNLFDGLRPEVEAHFVTAKSFKRESLAVIKEIERLHLHHSFLPDGNGGWPPWGYPKSLTDGVNLLRTVPLANIHALRHGWNCDAIYIATPKYIAGYAAAVWLSLRNKPVIAHVHALRPSRAQLRLWLPIISHYVFHAEISRQLMCAQFPEISKRTNTVISPLMPPVTLAAKQTRTTRKRILFVGQIAHHKGIDLLVEAFAQVVRKGHDAELHLVGGTAPEYRDELQRVLNVSGTADRIQCWGFLSSPGEVLASAAVYVQPTPPSRYQESGGCSVLEAMAAGIPVVCFRSGALEDLVQQGVTGLVVQQESAEALAEAILSILDDNQLATSMSEAAKDVFCRLFSWNVVREQWVNFFRTI